MKRLAVPSRARTRSRNGRAALGRRRGAPLPLPRAACSSRPQAHLRETLLVGASVDLKHILHAPDEGGILLRRDGPAPLKPGLYGTFLRVRRTNSRETGSSAHSSSTKRSARRRTLQRFVPFGGSEQARAIRCASCSPSSFFGLVALGQRWTSAASNPSRANLSRTRETVERLISRAHRRSWYRARRLGGEHLRPRR